MFPRLHARGEDEEYFQQSHYPSGRISPRRSGSSVLLTRWDVPVGVGVSKYGRRAKSYEGALEVTNVPVGLGVRSGLWNILKEEN